ncbi:MAG: alpha/beta hydrolase [Candidatus Eremiobacteraeota bacterium]|nr:alpha/beta hydrolase [Candidatus Eremiobacteraeota bacterium]
MTLLCIHGAGFTGRVFDAQREIDSQFRAPNLPGHQSPGEPASVDDFADYVEEYIKDQELDTIVLCGHSLGGAIALQLALRGLPQIQALVLLGSGARLRVAPQFMQGLQDDFESTAGKITSALFADRTSPLAAEARRSFAVVGQAQTLRDFAACNSFDATARLCTMHVPVLAMTGKHDVMTPPKYAQSLAAAVPDGSCIIIEDAGHMVMQERPAETNLALQKFVTGLGLKIR